MDNHNLEISFNRYSDSLSELKLFVDGTLNSVWELKYPVYKVDFGDIDGNKIPDILVGTIKPTRYYHKFDKRLFIFKITDRYYIRPLWLGSRVSQPLENFRFIENEFSDNIIRTIEKEQNGNFMVAEYKWKGFGLKFEKYIQRNIGKDKAYKIMNKE